MSSWDTVVAWARRSDTWSALAGDGNRTTTRVVVATSVERSAAGSVRRPGTLASTFAIGVYRARNTIGGEFTPDRSGPQREHVHKDLPARSRRAQVAAFCSTTAGTYPPYSTPSDTTTLSFAPHRASTSLRS